MVRNEHGARCWVLNIYNKSRKDFDDGEAGDDLFDAYLEDIEDMISVLSNPSSTPAVREEQTQVRKKINAEKNKTRKELGQRKEDREDQMQWFAKIAKMHDTEYSKYLPPRYTGNDIYNAAENPMAQDDEADQKKLKELFSVFELDEWGRVGLEVGNKEEAEKN